MSEPDFCADEGGHVSLNGKTCFNCGALMPDPAPRTPCACNGEGDCFICDETN